MVGRGVHRYKNNTILFMKKYSQKVLNLEGVGE